VYKGGIFVRERISLALPGRGIELTACTCLVVATCLRNKDTKVLIHQTVSRIRFHARIPTSAHDARTHVRSGCSEFSAVTFARRASRVPWHHPFPLGGGSQLATMPLWMRARSIDRTREMVLTLATWPFHSRLSSLPSGVPLILTRHARSFHVKHEGRSYAQILLIDAITARVCATIPTYQSDASNIRRALRANVLLDFIITIRWQIRWEDF